MSNWDMRPARDLDLPLHKSLRSTRREGGLVATLSQLVARVFVKAYLRLWHRVRHVGRERLPADCPLVLIANHSSHLDSVVLGAMAPWRIRKRMFPLAAGDVFFETPVLTVVAAYVINALPMWRKNIGRHAMDDLRTRLVEDRCAYILFPEGKRSDDGKMNPFKPGLGMLIAGTDIPVVPCYIDGADRALRKGSFLSRPARITVTVGDPMRFDDTPNDRDGWRAIAAKAEEAVRKLGGVPAATAAATVPSAEA